MAVTNNSANNAVLNNFQTIESQTTTTAGAQLVLVKNRALAAIQTGDTIGTVQYIGSDGSSNIVTSQINSVCSGTVAANRVASDLEFYTHPDSVVASTQRMVIASTGAVTVNTPDSGVGLTVAGGGFSALGTTTINTSGTGTTSIGTGSNSGTLALGNTSSGAVSIDCGTAGITVGTTANAHTTTVGSTNSTSATTLQCGSGALAITATNGTLTVNSGTGALGISTDASATTVSFATGGAVKTVTLGSTNSTSKTTVQAGSQGITLTGAVTSANAITITSGAMTVSSGDVVVTSGKITMPDTTSTVGILKIGTVNFLHKFGASNNAFGGGAGNLTGSFSATTGFGNNCLVALDGSGSANNTAVGTSAGAAITSGQSCTAVGEAAGSAWTTGNNNIALGAGVNGVAAEANVTRIGTSITKCFISGIRGITTVNNDAVAVLIDSAGQLGTTSSSIRFKENVKDMGIESGKVLDLRPVTFNYTDDAFEAKRYGLIAEEVEMIFPELVAYDEDKNPHSVKYHDLPVLLLNEIIKLKQRIQILETRLD